MQRQYTKTISTADVDPADNYGHLFISEEGAMIRVKLDTVDGTAEILLTPDQADDARNALTTIAARAFHTQQNQ